VARALRGAVPGRLAVGDGGDCRRRPGSPARRAASPVGRSCRAAGTRVRARLLADVAIGPPSRARRRDPGADGGGHGVGRCVAGDAGAGRGVRQRPPGQGLQRRAADDDPARHAAPSAPATAPSTRASTSRSRTCPTARCATCPRLLRPLRRAARRRARATTWSRSSSRCSTGSAGRGSASPVRSAARGLRALLPLPRGQVRRPAGRVPRRRRRHGEEPQVAAGGEEVHAWDAYGQPTGIHYRPHATNRAHQDAEWLDFQSCQTGHEAEHLPSGSPTCGATPRPREC
jgi:hypothetical protein